MIMHISPLSTTTYEAIIDCFYAAFADYFVPMPKDRESFRERWRKALVDYDLSFGMFDGDLLVGFMVHGIDRRNGKFIAFNNGTGVLPEYRGRRIVKSMYEAAIPQLKERGINHLALEVIQENAVAINAYQSVGFEITRSLNCYKGSLDGVESVPHQHQKVEFGEMDWDERGIASYLCWEHHPHCLKMGPYHYGQVIHKGQIESCFSILPESGYLTQF